MNKLIGGIVGIVVGTVVYFSLRPAPEPVVTWAIAVELDSGERYVAEATEDQCRTMVAKLRLGQRLKITIDGEETGGSFLQCLQVEDGRVKKVIKAEQEL